VTLSVQGALFDHDERRWLRGGAWIDVRSGWLADQTLADQTLPDQTLPDQTLADQTQGADSLFAELADTIPWRAERRQMYDRVLDVPRLVSFHDLVSEPAPHPVLKRLRRRLNDRYAGELGEPFTTAGLCLYRDGADSVAWHGDTIGRGSTEDTMVAILSLGATRVFALRPRSGPDGRRQPTLRLAQAHGDLIVMGGSCQRTWEHSIPKTAKPTGPRISIQFRPQGVR
jgi:alkylated DNA repair dioxygenase AlkB